MCDNNTTRWGAECQIVTCVNIFVRVAKYELTPVRPSCQVKVSIGVSQAIIWEFALAEARARRSDLGIRDGAGTHAHLGIRAGVGNIWELALAQAHICA